MRLLLLSICSLLIMGSCKYFEPKQNPEPLARVGDSYLYKTDLDALGITDLNEEDSLKLVKSFIDNWINKQVLLQNASKYLNNEQLVEVDQKVLDYKESLLSFLYESQVVQQKVDTIVSEDEIQQYYTSHEKDFAVNEPIVQFISIKNDKQMKNTKQITKWIQELEEEGNDAQLREFCSLQAIDCNFDHTTWVPISKLYETLGVDESTKNKVQLRIDRLFELEGNNYFYLYKLFNIKQQGIYPVEYVSKDIKELIIRQRQKAFVEDLRSKIIASAKNNNEIEIYD